MSEQSRKDQRPRGRTSLPTGRIFWKAIELILRANVAVKRSRELIGQSSRRKALISKLLATFHISGHGVAVPRERFPRRLNAARRPDLSDISAYRSPSDSIVIGPKSTATAS